MSISVTQRLSGSAGTPPGAVSLSVNVAIGDVIIACLMTNSGQSMAATNGLNVYDSVNPGLYQLIGQFPMPDGTTVLSAFMKQASVAATVGINPLTVQTSNLAGNFGILSVVATSGWTGYPAIDLTIGGWTADSTLITADSPAFINAAGVAVASSSLISGSLINGGQITAQPKAIAILVDYTAGTSIAATPSGWSPLDTAATTSYYKLAPSAGASLAFSASLNAATSDSGSMLLSLYDAPTIGAIFAAAMQGEASFGGALAVGLIAQMRAIASLTIAGNLSALMGAESSAISINLLNWSSVLLSAPLYYGLGGALDGYLWPANQPQAGTTLYYDGTNMSIAADGEITATSNNFSALLGFYDSSGHWYQALYTISPGEVGYLQSQASMSATLSGAAITMASAAADIASMAAALSTDFALSSAAADSASMSAALTNGAIMAAQGSAIASMSAPLSTSFALRSSAAALAKASAALSALIRSAAAGSSIARLAAALTTNPAIMTAAGARATMSPTLTNIAAAHFQAAAAAIASAAAALSTQIPLASQARAIAYGAAFLSTPKPIAAAAAGRSAFASAIRTGAGWFASPGALASAAAQLRTATGFATMGSAIASITAGLKALPSLPVPLLLSHQIPGIYQPGAEPFGQFPLSIGEKSAYGIDWSYWIAFLWQPGFLAPLNYVIRPFPWTGFQYICTAAGQTGAYPPIWPEELGQFVVDGSAIWQAASIDSSSLQTSVIDAQFSCSPAGLILSPYAISGNITPVLVDASAAAIDTSYEVSCTADMASGDFLIGKMVFNVW